MRQPWMQPEQTVSGEDTLHSEARRRTDVNAVRSTRRPVCIPLVSSGLININASMEIAWNV